MTANIHLPVAVDHILWSSSSGRIFFSDVDREVISSINLDGSGMRCNWVQISSDY